MCSSLSGRDGLRPGDVEEEDHCPFLSNAHNIHLSSPTDMAVTEKKKSSWIHRKKREDVPINDKEWSYFVKSCNKNELFFIEQIFQFF